MTTTTIYPAHLIAAPHEVTDAHKAALLAESMQADGWQGEPLLVVAHGDGYQAWTGTHRLAAAEVAGVAVPVHVLTLSEAQEEALVASGWYDAMYSRPLDQECVLAELCAMDDVDAEAVRLLQVEVAKDV